MDLTPAEGSFDPQLGTSGYVPGWTARGHAGYWGYAWYRMRVQLDEAGAARSSEKLAGEQLVIEGPNDFDDVFQVFANGKLLGGFGDFSGKTPVTYFSVPTLFPLPAPAGTTNEAAADDSGDFQTEVVVLRVWMGPGELVTQPDAGGLHSPPALGHAGAVAADCQLRWLELVRAYSPDVALGLQFALMAVAAFTLVLFDRSDRVYQWICAVFVLQAIYNGTGAFGTWTQHLSATALILLHDCLVYPLIQAGWVMVWWIWFGRQRPAWIPRAAAGLALRITANGDVTLANAGHMPPYLNGQPVTMEGALPLGIFAGAEPSVVRFTLEHEDRLALISDGIVEAMDANRQLFGFERIQALLNKHVTAIEVADAAQNFGQEDDISVIAVARTAVLEPALV